ncbi:MAG: TonB-dependent receptor plug domain-containing protein [Rhodospirillaceae bacterium]
MYRIAACGRLAISLAAFFMAAEVRAQESGASTQVYDRAYFEKYDTVTAEDMVRRVPGTSSILDGLNSNNNQQQRGFGSAGEQVLLNGKRFAGKNQILAALKRIQSANVLRVELIRGNTADANVQSEGLIINVVLEEGAGTGSGSWQAAFRANDNDIYDVDGLLSYSDTLGSLDYIVSVRREAWNRGYPFWRTLEKTERYFFPGGALREERIERAEYNQKHQYTLTADLTYNFENGDTLRLNGAIEPRLAYDTSDIEITRYNPAGAVIQSGTEIQFGRQGWQKQWEVGGDYEALFGATRLNVLFIHSYEREPNDEYRTQIFGPVTAELNRNINLGTQIESIIRPTAAWSLTPAQTLELGGEVARNIGKQHLRPFFDLNADGRVEEAVIPTGNAEVKEIRGEAFANHTWQITPALSLNSSLIVEMSRITNNFPSAARRPTYVYAKPRADLRYDMTPLDQLRFKIDRRVSQLDFDLFVPEFDLQDNEIDEGNPDIRPERQWEFEAGYQRQLAGDQGLVELRAFYNHIEDHIAPFLLRVEPNGVRVSASGNTGTAKHYGAEAKASVRMTPLGLPDLTVDARFLRQWGEATDPFLGIKRQMGGTEFNNDLWTHELQVGFRHDVTAWGFTYGANYHERAGELLNSDIRVQRRFSVDPRLDVFAEKTLTPNLTLRVEAYHLMPKRMREFQRRTVYADDVIAGTIARTETFVTHWDRMLAIVLRGTF